jgi:membrane-bound ClpP family serine protease
MQADMGGTMNTGVIAIGLSIICLVASFAFALPGWINLVGIGLGIVGLVMLGRARKDDRGQR